MQGRIDDYVSATQGLQRQDIQGRIDRDVSATQGGGSPAECYNEANQKRIDAEQKVLQEKLQTEYKLQCVRDLAEKRQPVSGTQAEKYLSSRGISLSGLSDDMGYIKAGTKFNYLSDGNKVERTIYNGALISVGRDNNKEITGVQLTYLKDGAKQQDKEGNPLTKRQYGTFTSSLVNVHNPQTSNTAIICEGLETACSIKESLGLDKSNDIGISIYASNGISNIKNIKDKNYKNIIIASDYYGVGAKTHDKIKLVSKELQESGTCLSVLYPEHEKNSTAKIDYNDLLKSDNGKEKIYDQFTHEISKLDKYLHKEITEKNNLNVNIEKDKIAGNINESVITNDYSQKDKLQDKDVVLQDALAESDATQSVSTQVPRDDEPAKIDSDTSGENNPITDPKILSALSDLAKARFHLLALSKDEASYNSRVDRCKKIEEKLINNQVNFDKFSNLVSGYNYNKPFYNYMFGDEHMDKEITIPDRAKRYVDLLIERDESRGFKVSEKLKSYEYGKAEENPESIINSKQELIKMYLDKEVGKEFIVNSNDNSLVDSELSSHTNSSNDDSKNNDANSYTYVDLLQENQEVESLEQLHAKITVNDRLGITDEKLEEKYKEECLLVGRDDKLMDDLRLKDSKLADRVDEKVEEDEKHQEKYKGPELEL